MTAAIAPHHPQVVLGLTKAYEILVGDVRDRLNIIPSKSVHCVATSGPYYYLRDYGNPDQIGLEHIPDCRAWARGEPPCTSCFVCAYRTVFGGTDRPEGVWRVLRDDGILFLNLGDSYAGSWGAQSRPEPDDAYLSGNQQRAAPKATHTGTVAPESGLKPKDLIGIPWRVAFALQADGWFLRMDHPCDVWAKNNSMPESVDDRASRNHEYVFHLAKSPRYFYDGDAIREPDAGRGSGNKARRVATDGERQRVNTHLGSSIPWTPDGTGRNARSVITVNTKPSTWAYCLSCDSFFNGAARSKIRAKIVDAEGRERAVPQDWWTADTKTELSPGEREVHVCPTCSSTDAWVDHFAIWPPDLVERFILAGTSAHGACADCGAPYERVTDKTTRRRAAGAPAQTARKQVRAIDRVGATSAFRTGTVPVTMTLGWRATCVCNEDGGGRGTVPCTVLDPFAGSGTTLLVALNHGRRALGIELNASYAALARRRIETGAPAATARRLDAFQEAPEE